MSGSNSVAEQIRELVTMDEAARHYGFQPGRSGFIHCPFHQGDHTASLKLYPGKDGFYCFGCQAHGSVIDFVMLLFHLSFNQAVVRINADFGLGLSLREPAPEEAARMRAERREREERQRHRQEEKARSDAEWRRLLAEKWFWTDVTKYLSPEALGVRWIHPLYARALVRLDCLDACLDWILEETAKEVKT